MNYQTGQIMAMASYPTFDNRWFSAGVGGEKFDEIFPTDGPDGEQLDPDPPPLANRAIQGQYNMGSTFKVFTAYAALATGPAQRRHHLQRPGHVHAAATRSQHDACAPGVRCVFRNSFCPRSTGRAGTATINVMQSLAVSSDAFFYKLGEEFYLTPGTQLQDQVACSASAPTPASTCRSSSTGGCRRTSSRRSSSRSGVLGRGRGREHAARRRPAAGDRPGPAGGDAAAARRRLLGVRQRRATWCSPHVVQAILEPETPDGAARLRRPDAGRRRRRRSPRPSRPIPMPPEVHDPIQDGIRRNITGPGVNGRSHDRRGAVPRLPGRRDPGRRQDGHRAGRHSYPWNDSSAFAAYSVEPEQPLHRRVLPREGGLRVDGRGAGRQVHVPRPVGQDPARPGRRSPSRSTPRSRRPAHGAAATSTRRAWRSASTIPVRPPD